MFEVVFDYDEGHVINETTNSDQQTLVEASSASTTDWPAATTRFHLTAPASKCAPIAYANGY